MLGSRSFFVSIASLGREEGLRSSLRFSCSVECDSPLIQVRSAGFACPGLQLSFKDATMTGLPLRVCQNRVCMIRSGCEPGPQPTLGPLRMSGSRLLICKGLRRVCTAQTLEEVLGALGIMRVGRTRCQFRNLASSPSGLKCMDFQGLLGQS